MAYRERQRLIKRIEKLRDSRLLTLVASDRPIAPTIIADDSLEPVYEHLLKMSAKGKPERIDLFLYTRGGRIDVPWKLVAKLRPLCQELTVIVPYRAHSSGTMIALGADKVLMSAMSELGPIDPFLQMEGDTVRAVPAVIHELYGDDRVAYLNFLKEWAGITDQSVLEAKVRELAVHLPPAVLAQISRLYSHLRLMTRRLLALGKPPLTEARIASIVDALTGRIYPHGHGISIEEARSIGLNVEEMPQDLGKLVWALYLDYEGILRLDANPDPYSYFTDDRQDKVEETDAIGICIESVGLLHVFAGTIEIERLRRVPQELSINLSFPVELPHYLRPEALPDEIKEAIDRVVQQAGEDLRDQVHQEILRQAPVDAVRPRWVGGAWRRAEGEGR